MKQPVFASIGLIEATHRMNSGIPRDGDSAKLKTAADQMRVPIAQFVYGAFAYFGIGMAKDGAEKLAYLGKARKGGRAEIQMAIARVYMLEGPGFVTEVARCLRAAAADGDGSAKRTVQRAKAQRVSIAVLVFLESVNQKQKSPAPHCDFVQK